MKNYITIYEVISGSRAYGFANENSDTDIRGVAFPSYKSFFGLHNFEMAETKDPDMQIYSFKKFVTLALNANPNILELLFIDDPSLILKQTSFSATLKAHRHLFITKKIFTTYMGYAKAQIHKLKAAGNCSPEMSSKRAEGIKKYGYDIKAATHVARLLYQGIELALDKTISIPLKEPALTICKNIRNGDNTLDEFLGQVDFLFDVFKGLEEISTLPEKPNYKAADDLVAYCHTDFYLGQ